MAQNWLRSCSLSFGGSSSKVVQGGGSTDLRIVFSIEMGHAQSSNMARIRVYNPSPDTRSKLKQKEFTAVSLSAGYQGREGVIFSGNIVQTISGHETAVDTYVDIFGADGDQGYISAKVNKTLGAGWTPQDKLNVAMEAFKPFGITLGVNNLDLSTPKFPRGAPFAGMARELVQQIAMSKGGLWSIQQGKLMLTPKSLETGSGDGPIELTAATGLIGWPKQLVTGIQVVSLINPALQPLKKIKLDPSQIIEAERDNNPLSLDANKNNQNFDVQALGAGTYTIYKLDRYGDTRGQEWYDTSICIGIGGDIPPSVQQSTPGYYLGGGEAVQDSGFGPMPGSNGSNI